MRRLSLFLPLFLLHCAPSTTGSTSSSGSPADTTPPTVAITGPAESGPTVLLMGTAADDTGVQTVRVSNGSTVLGEATPVDGAWSINTQLAEGVHSLEAVATDAAGNEGSAQASITVHAAGTLDETFGTGGLAAHVPPQPSDQTTTLVDDQGRVIILGWVAPPYTTGVVMRLLPDGSLDQSFDGDGFVEIADRDNATGSVLHGGAIQPDGKIVGVGGDSLGRMVLRLNPDGSLDADFGVRSLQTDGTFTDVIIQPDGKILLAGEGTPPARDMVFTRLNADGSPDMGFGSQGSARMDFALAAGEEGSGDHASAVALLPDGKIVAAGGAWPSGSNTFGIGVARLNADGTPDESFGNNGRVRTMCTMASSCVGNHLAVQADGKIVVVGRHLENFNQSFVLARYNTDGTLDASFGEGGLVLPPSDTTDYTGQVVLVRDDGKLLVGTVDYTGNPFNVLLLQFTASGALDASFGDAGALRLASPRAAALQPGGIVVMPDGRLVIGTTLYDEEGSAAEEWGVLRVWF